MAKVVDARGFGFWVGFGMVSFGLGRGQRGLISSNIGVYRHLWPSGST